MKQKVIYIFFIFMVSYKVHTTYGMHLKTTMNFLAEIGRVLQDFNPVHSLAVDSGSSIYLINNDQESVELPKPEQAESSGRDKKNKKIKGKRDA